MDILISAIAYGLAGMVTIGIAFSYWIAYRMTKSLSILSLFLYFSMSSILTVLTFIAYISASISGSMLSFPLSSVRGVLLFGAAIFLFYTTWKIESPKNKVSGKISEVLREK